MQNQVLNELTTDEFRELIKGSLESYYQSRGDCGGIPSKQLLSKKELANIYGVSVNTINNWSNKGDLPREVKKGSRAYYLRSEVFNQLKEKDERGN
jgi:predicted DNA-binding transcriptional regulator AlpA